MPLAVFSSPFWMWVQVSEHISTHSSKRFVISTGVLGWGGWGVCLVSACECRGAVVSHTAFLEREQRGVRTQRIWVKSYLACLWPWTIFSFACYDEVSECIWHSPLVNCHTSSILRDSCHGPVTYTSCETKQKLTVGCLICPHKTYNYKTVSVYLVLKPAFKRKGPLNLTF